MSKAVPDYDEQCSICGNSPCVDLVEDGEVVQSTGMCGPCTFGDASMADEVNW